MCTTYAPGRGFFWAGSLRKGEGDGGIGDWENRMDGLVMQTACLLECLKGRKEEGDGSGEVCSIDLIERAELYFACFLMGLIWRRFYLVVCSFRVVRCCAINQRG